MKTRKVRGDVVPCIAHHPQVVEIHWHGPHGSYVERREYASQLVVQSRQVPDDDTTLDVVATTGGKVTIPVPRVGRYGKR